jgi:hypothetical protein
MQLHGPSFVFAVWVGVPSFDHRPTKKLPEHGAAVVPSEKIAAELSSRTRLTADGKIW